MKLGSIGKEDPQSTCQLSFVAILLLAERMCFQTTILHTCCTRDYKQAVVSSRDIILIVFGNHVLNIESLLSDFNVVYNQTSFVDVSEDVKKTRVITAPR
jgi:hypothetical protein